MGTVSESGDTVHTHPPIGLIATENNRDAVVRTVAFAHDQGHEVLVTYPGPNQPYAVEAAEQLGAEVVHPAGDVTEKRSLRQFLTTVARSHDFPGLLFHPNPDKCVDYEQSRVRHAEQSEYTVTTCTRRTYSHGESVLVAIPAFNEAATIAEVVQAAQNHADTVLVIDDGSTDETRQIAQEAGATVHSHTTNRGYGAALQTAFVEAARRTVETLIILDGDGQHNPDDIPKLIETLEEDEADIVIGSRFAAGSNTEFPFYRWLGLSVINILTNLSLGVVRPQSWVNDTQCGFRAYGRDAITSLAHTAELGDRMSASTDILYHAHKHDYTIEEVGTTVDYTVDNANNHHPLTHGLTLVKNILKTIERERPITILGIPGLTATFVGIGLGYWTVSHYITTATFSLGLALSATAISLCGIFACFTAIILHSLTTHFTEV